MRCGRGNRGVSRWTMLMDSIPQGGTGKILISKLDYGGFVCLIQDCKVYTAWQQCREEKRRAQICFVHIAGKNIPWR